MRLAIQRVTEARVDIDGVTSGRIQQGLLVLAGLGHGDSEAMFPKVVDKLVNLRIFADENGNINRSLCDVQGGLLLVSQFTLYADIRKGRRPSFTNSMPPGEAQALFARFVDAVKECYTHGPVETGEFGAMMQVHLVNDGPVTIWLDTRDLGFDR